MDKAGVVGATLMGGNRRGDHACRNRHALLTPFVLSVIRMLESDFATAEDIDRGLVLGSPTPRGRGRWWT